MKRDMKITSISCHSCMKKIGNQERQFEGKSMCHRLRATFWVGLVQSLKNIGRVIPPCMGFGFGVGGPGTRKSLELRYFCSHAWLPE
jgi:hypothetical protein